MHVNVGLLLFAVLTCSGGNRFLQNKHPPLVRLRPEKQGHKQILQLPGLDKPSVMTTVNVEPPIFFIDDFLTPKECSHIIKLAKRQGMENSPVGDEFDYLDQDFIDEFDPKEAWEDWNINGDEWIDKEELIQNMMDLANAKFSSDDADEMLSQLKLDKDLDGKLNYEEFASSDVVAVNEFINKVRDANPWYKVRYSSQTWLRQDSSSDPVLQQLRERLIALTHLPPVIVETSEHIQVVHYDVGGHYHCHLDTDPEEANQTCCYLTSRMTDGCRLCRFLTLLYYLNEVPDGGATAFPGAWMEPNLDYSEFQSTGLCNLSAQCNSGLVVKPKLGSAVLWYSHFVDNDGQLSRVDNRTIHGGCDVIKGEKWIANNWIDIDGFVDYNQLDAEMDGTKAIHSEL